jgi:hypothetical protein
MARGYSLTFLRLVRVSRTKEALQLRSLMTGRDFVNFMSEMVFNELNMFVLTHATISVHIYIQKTAAFDHCRSNNQMQLCNLASSVAV